MEPLITSALIGAGSSLVSGIGSFIGGTKAANMSAAASRQNMKDQLAWEKERATNAYQWAADDLEKAGLNKNLLNHNAGAAVTGSLTPQMPDYSGYKSAYEAMGNTLKDTLNTALGVKEKLSQIKNIEAQTEERKENSALSRALAITEAAKAGYIDSQTAHELIKKAATELRLELDSKYGEYERWAGLAKAVSGIAKDVATPFAQYFGIGKVSKMLQKAKPLKKSKLEYDGTILGQTKSGDIFNKNTGEILW